MINKISAISILFFIFFVTIANNNIANASENWKGNYVFFERDPGDYRISWRYELNILEKCKSGSGCKKYIANFKIDGYQTLVIIDKIKIREKGVNQIFLIVSKPPINCFPGNYKKGDILFSLKRNNGNLYTEWHKIKPRLEDNCKICFKK